MPWISYVVYFLLVAPASPEYVGCWFSNIVDTEGAVQQPTGLASGSIAACSSLCTEWGSNLAAMRDGKFCYCGDSLPAGDTSTDTMCETPCTDVTSDYCGAGGLVVVYYLIKDIGFEMRLNKNGSTVAELTFDHSPLLAAKYQLDWGYGFFPINYSNAYFLDLFSPGGHTITSVVRDDISQTNKTWTDTAGIWFDDELKGNITLQCSSLTQTTDEDIECDIIDVISTSIDISSSTGESWLAEGADYEVMGPAMVLDHWYIEIGPSTADVLFVISPVILTQQYVTDVRVHAAVAGDIILELWQSDWCNDTDESNTDCKFIDCESVKDEYCGISGDCCNASITHTNSLPLRLHSSTVLSLYQGIQTIKMETPMIAVAGCILGYRIPPLSTAKLYKFKMATREDDYNISSVTSAFNHQIQTLLVRPASVSVIVHSPHPTGSQQISVVLRDGGGNVKHASNATVHIVDVSTPSPTRLNISSFDVSAQENIKLYDVIQTNFTVFSEYNSTCSISVGALAVHQVLLSACSNGCFESVSVNITDLQAIIMLTVYCADAFSYQNQSIALSTLSTPSALQLTHDAIEAGTTTNLTFSMISANPATVAVQIGTFAPVYATYNPVHELYTAAISTPAEGVYQLLVNATNNIGTSFFVTDVYCLSPISGFSIITEYGRVDETTTLNITGLSFEEATTNGLSFNISLATGSNVTATVDWGDSLTENLTLPITLIKHVYVTGGSYVISIVATSPLRVETTLLINLLIITPLADGLVIDTGRRYYTPSGQLAVEYLVVDRITGQAPPIHQPNKVSMTIYGGDGSNKIIYPAMIGQAYAYEYEELDKYNVTIVLTNPIGQLLVIFMETELLWPIIDMELRVNPSHASLLESTNVAVAMSKGDDVNITWDFGDGSGLQQVVQSALKTHDANHTYAAVGNYTITVTAENIMSRVSMTYDIYVQKPVLPTMFNITSNSPVIYPDALELTVLYSALPQQFPTSLFIYIDYGDGRFIRRELLQSVNNTSVYTLDVTSSGVYLGYVELSNLGSSVITPLQVSSVEIIENVTFEVMWRPEKPRNAEARYGTGPKANNFPLDQPVIYDVRAEKGSPILYQVFTENLQTGDVNYTVHHSSPISMLMSQAGSYNVTIVCSNALSSITTNSTFTVQRTIATSSSHVTMGVWRNNTFLPSSKAILPGELAQFYIDLGEGCDECCIAVDMGDGSVVQYFSSNAPNGSYCKDDVTTRQMTNPLLLNHTYFLPGAYAINIHVYSSFSNNTVIQHPFVVSTRDCSKPLLSIENQRRSFVDAEKRLKGAMSTIHAYTVLVCSDTLVNHKIWRAYRLDTQLGRRLNEVELSGLPTHSTAQLVIPKRFLQYGVYELEFTVSMTGSADGVPFTASVSTFIEIKRSDLLTRLLDGSVSKVDRGTNQLIVLEPEKYTVDPDLAAGLKANLTGYKWYCNRKGEVLPTDAVTGKLLEEPMYREEQSKDVTYDKGGCYGTGPGRLDWHMGTINVNSSLLLTAMTYVFTVQVTSADGRTGLATLEVEIKEEEVLPEVTIRCADGGICTPAIGGQEVNPTNQLAMYAECLSSDCPSTVHYDWQISYMDIYGFWKTIDEVNRYIAGTNSKGIRIAKSLFHDYADTCCIKFDTKYQSGLDNLGSHTGRASLIVFVNTPPYDGYCYITPSHVISSNDPFHVSCADWKDNGEIMMYEIYAQYDNKSLLIHYDDDLTNARIYLPAGVSAEGYLVGIQVKVLDNLKAFTLYYLGLVRVERNTLSDLYTSLDQSLTEEIVNEVVLQGGDIQQVSQEVTRRADFLNGLSEMIAKSFSDESQVAAEFTTLKGTDVDTWGAFDPIQLRAALNVTQSSSAEQALQQYNLYRDQVSQMKERFISALAAVGTGSTESVLLVSTALQTATESYSELNRVSQLASIDLLQQLSNRLYERTIDSTQEELIEVTENILGSIKNIFEGSSLQVDNPIQSDYAEARKVWDYDTDLESSEPWLDTGDTLDVTLDNLQHFTNNKLQKQASLSVASKGLSSIRKLSTTVVRNKVAGDDAIEIHQENMNVFISKDASHKLTGSTYHMGGATVAVPAFCDLRPNDCAQSDQAQQKVISLSSAVLRRNPFYYDSKVDAYKDLSHVNVSSVSRSSAALIFAYYDEEGNELSIENTETPIMLTIPQDMATSDGSGEFTRKLVPVGRPDLLVNELVRVATMNVTLVVQILDVSRYQQLLMFVKYQSKPDLVSNNYDAKYLVEVADTPEKGTYLGCYDEGKMTSANGTEVYHLGSANQVKVCIDICGPQGFPYAALQAGTKCYCGHFYLRDGKLDNTYCNVSCTGNNSLTCGGSLALSTYHTGHHDGERLPTTVTIDESVIRGRTGTFYASFAPVAADYEVTALTLSQYTDYRELLVANASYSYSIRFNTIGCYFFDETTRAVSADGCRVGAESAVDSVQCFCNHLTSFASGWVVAPNTIDFATLNYDPSDNPIVYILLVSIVTTYILLVIWARRMDKKDLTKLGSMPMGGNDPLDRYLYEVLFATGSRTGSGTKSQVYLVISGEEEETSIRPVHGGKREILRRGQTDKFLLAVPRPLGQIQYIRIWHDNSGKGECSSWFLNYLVIKDLQTRQKWYFIVNKWFALEEDDGEIDRVIAVSGEDDLVNFSHLFTEVTKRDLADDHLWFSVFTRPVKSRFTRVQRVSCCLLLLLLSMVTSAMFYEKDKTDTVGLKIGPFTLTPQQVAIGLYTNLIVFTASLLIIQMFRRSRRRSKKRNSTQWMNSANHYLASPYYQSFDSIQESQVVTSQSPKRKTNRPFTLPWWCRTLAWILLWVAVITCTVFVYLYSLDFGNNKTSKWITSMIISFLSSVLITQPVKVILMAIFFSVIVKNPNIDDDLGDEEDEVTLGRDEEWVHYQHPDHHVLKPSMKPLNQKLLAILRERRLKEVKMYEVIREIVIYCVFVSVLVVMSSDAQHIHSNYLKRHMDNTFVKQGDKFHQDFTKIRNVSNFWYWTRETLIHALKASPWYNNQPAVNLRGFLDDKTSRIMGYAIIRQLRIPMGTCGVPEKLVGVVNKCVGEYTFAAEQKKDFGPRWSNQNVEPDNWPEYIYRSAAELDGLPFLGRISLYGGGGYVFELRGSVESLVERSRQLEDIAWIDQYTRAVFIEFTVYSPGANLFSINTMLLEMPASGSSHSKWRFNPMQLLQYVGAGAIYKICGQVAFGLFVVGFAITEGRCIKKQKKAYFKEFWNWMELAIIILSLAAIILFIVQYIFMKKITQLFKVTKGDAYMKFQLVAYWTELYHHVTGILIFFTILKLIKLFRFNKKMSLLADTLRHCGYDLAKFAIIFMIVFFSFVLFFHIILLNDMNEFITFIRSWETCFAMILGRFEFQEMTRSNKYSPIFFILFMVVNMFILLNMALSIIIESFTSIKNDINLQRNEYEIVDYIVNRFKNWTGLEKSSDDSTISFEKLLEEDKEEDHDLVGQFPFRVELLMKSLRKCYFDGTELGALVKSKSVERVNKQRQRWY